MNFELAKEITTIEETTVIDALVYAYLIELNVRKLQSETSEDPDQQHTLDCITNAVENKTNPLDLIKKFTESCNYINVCEPRYAPVGKYMTECSDFMNHIIKMDTNHVDCLFDLTPVPNMDINIHYLGKFIKEYIFQNYAPRDFESVGSCDIYLALCYIKALQELILSSIPSCIDIALTKISEIKRRVQEVTSESFASRDSTTYNLITTLVERCI